MSDLSFPPIVTEPAIQQIPAIPATLRAAALAHFNSLELPLRALAERYRAVAFDLSTPKGLAAAKAARNDLRENGRYAVQRAEDAFKAAANEAKKAVTPVVENLIGIVRPTEDDIDRQIKDHEARVEAARVEAERVAAEKAAAEAARVQAHRSNLATIRGYANKARGKTSVQIEAGFQVVAKAFTEFNAAAWEEFADEAKGAYEAAVEELCILKAQAVKAEADAAELARLRAEKAVREAQEAREREQMRISQRVLVAYNEALKRVPEEWVFKIRDSFCINGVVPDEDRERYAAALDALQPLPPAATIAAQNSPRQESVALTGGNPENMAHQTADAAPGGGQAEGEGASAPSPGSSAAGSSQVDDGIISPSSGVGGMLTSYPPSAQATVLTLDGNVTPEEREGLLSGDAPQCAGSGAESATAPSSSDEGKGAHADTSAPSSIVEHMPIPATLTIGKINERLDPVSVSAAGLERLGFAKQIRPGPGSHFLLDDWPQIKIAILRHVRDLA